MFVNVSLGTIKLWKGINMRTTLAAFLIFLLAINQVSANSDISNDELHRAYGDPPDLLNPLISNDTTSGTFQGHTTESFASRRVQNPNEWEPFLAEEWKSSETDDGKLVFDIKLREGVKWHKVTVKTSDGVKAIEPVEFTSKDVVFSYRVVMNPNVRCPSIRSYTNSIILLCITDRGGKILLASSNTFRSPPS